MIKLILTLLAPILLGLSYLIGMLVDDGLSPSSRIVYQTIKLSGARIAKEYGMHMCGFGAGHSKEEQIGLFSLSFQLRRPIKQEEAREMIVKITQEFLADINSSEKVRPYLTVYPFEIKNVEIVIFSSMPDGHDTHHPDLNFVDIVNGRISYLTKDSDGSPGYKSDTKESFEEAVTILNHNKEISSDNPQDTH